MQVLRELGRSGNVAGVERDLNSINVWRAAKRLHLSDSAVQPEVEPMCLQFISDTLNVPLAPEGIRLAVGDGNPCC